MMNDERRKIASKLREKFGVIECSLLHPDGSEPNWSVEELFEVLDIDYPECLNPWECPYDYIADLIDVPAIAVGATLFFVWRTSSTTTHISRAGMRLRRFHATARGAALRWWTNERN